MMPQKPDYPPCPQCRKPFTRRSQREGLFERCLSLVHVYPFRCQLCAHRFRALNWGANFVKYRPDRRAYVRLPVRYPVTFTGDMTGAGTIANLSIQGCGIETDAVPPQGAILQLTLHETNGQPAIEVEAAVVRSVVSRTRQVGVEFLRLQASESERLRRVIETHWHDLSIEKGTTIGGRSFPA
jgi:hypothetical protein